MRQEETNTQVSDRCHWAALQTIRPEYPVNFPKPLSLVALRIKATAQLNGALDNFNALAQAYAPTWDGEDWVAEGLTRNPASAVLRILQSPANTYPVADAGLYLDELSEWFEWCAARDLKYDFVHESEMKLWEALQVICQAGRASPRHDGIRWGVILDRPDLPVIYHINPRNSDGMNWGRTYFNPPDGFRVSFRDETNDYEVAERIVPWPGFEGEVELTEALQLPGKTDPDEIYIEATRRALELEYRPDTITTVLDSQAHVVTRGDKVMGSFNRLVSTQAVARVKSVRGTLVELDEEVTMSAGVDYAIRFFSFASDEDAEGEPVVVAVNARTGTTRAIALTSDAQMPREGDLVQFGVLGLESLALRVVSIEPGSNFSSVLRCVADAPEIDAAIDALVVPAWNGRVGAEVEIAAAAPGVPTITGIDHGTVGTGDPDGLRVLFAPSTGSVITASIRVEHKLSGDAEYSSLTVSAGSGAADIPGYSFGDEVDIRLVAIATDGTSESAATSVATIVIGAGDPALPDALDAGAILITGRLGFASISVPTGSDPSLSRLQIYRAPSGVALDRDVHSVGSPYGVTLSTTMTFIDGDATRSNLLPNSTFDDATGATLGTGWAVAGGVATHTAGSAGTLSQTVALTGGKTYRGALVVAGRTAGDLTPKLIGGTDQSATSISADGVAYFAIEAVAGNVEFGLTAGTDFDGNVDALVLFEMSANSIPQGTFDYYIEPQNSAGGAGPVAGPFETTVV